MNTWTIDSMNPWISRVFSSLNFQIPELLHFPTPWWYSVDVMMWLTWWCSWNRMWLTLRWNCWPCQLHLSNMPWRCELLNNVNVKSSSCCSLVTFCCRNSTIQIQRPLWNPQFLTCLYMWNWALGTVLCTFCRPHLPKVLQTWQFYNMFKLFKCKSSSP